MGTGPTARQCGNKKHRVFRWPMLQAATQWADYRTTVPPYRHVLYLITELVVQGNPR